MDELTICAKCRHSVSNRDIARYSHREPRESEYIYFNRLDHSFSCGLTKKSATNVVSGLVTVSYSLGEAVNDGNCKKFNRRLSILGYVKTWFDFFMLKDAHGN